MNLKLFSKLHPDYIQLTLAVFLMFERSKGNKSFWHPYLQVMNQSDLLYDWTDDQIDLCGDKTLNQLAFQYKAEIEQEWNDLNAAVFSKHPDLFGPVTKEDFFTHYNLCCTRVIGWGTPSAMMVPLIDFINYGPDRESRLDFLHDDGKSVSIKLAISSNKRRLNTLAGVQTDFGGLFID